MDYTVVIPVLNALRYSRQCDEHLLASGVPGSSILVIDNGSTDETPQWLAATPAIRSVRNAVNLGCGGAWTQGALLTSSEWTVLLNNDVVFAHGVVQDCLAAADRFGLDVVSPGLMEGELDYDLAAFTEKFRRQMAGVKRWDTFHGVFFAVRRRVFHRIGFLDTDRLLGGAEDLEFLIRCRRHGVPVATVGDAVLHHFGSITQKELKAELGVRALGDYRYAWRRMGQGWWGRGRIKRATRAQTARFRDTEVARHGMSLHMLRAGGVWTPT